MLEFVVLCSVLLVFCGTVWFILRAIFDFLRTRLLSRGEKKRRPQDREKPENEAF